MDEFTKEYNTSSYTSSTTSSEKVSEREDKIEINTNSNYNTYSTKQYISFRNLLVDTLKRYGAVTRVDDQDVPLAYELPYGPEGAKVRPLAGPKMFPWSGSAQNSLPLFGMDKFSAGSAMSITITEGEVDAMSVYQIMGSKYPAVSVRGAASAATDCKRAHKYLDSFSKIYLCFDNDEPGRKAAASVGALFNPNKVFIVNLTKHKDANEYLTKGDSKELYNAWYNARVFHPKGIVASFSDIENVLKKADNLAKCEYPFPTLQQLTYGIRTSELVLFTAQEKVGKTEVMRAIEYHLLANTEDPIGIIHLEEQEKRSIQGLLGYHLKTPVHLPDSPVSLEDQISAYKDMVKAEGRLHFYTHFGSEDPNTILQAIRYLVAVCGCKYVFLDHITMLVTGSETDDERKTLDYISTQLAMLTRELDFCLFLVSHVNDDGKTRGSRNISKVADLIIHLDRDIEGATIAARNKTSLLVKGNRYAGATGPAGYLWFDPHSYTIKELEADDLADIPDETKRTTTFDPFVEPEVV